MGPGLFQLANDGGFHGARLGALTLRQLAVGDSKRMLFPLAAYFLDPVVSRARPVPGN
jgi:hypothetical protein